MPKDKKIWFKAKLYGWGWYPVSWQGWGITLAYILFLARTFVLADKESHSVSDTLIRVAGPFIVVSLMFLFFCYTRGERPRWRWRKDLI